MKPLWKELLDFVIQGPTEEEERGAGTFPGRNAPDRGRTRSDRGGGAQDRQTLFCLLYPQYLHWRARIVVQTELAASAELFQPFYQPRYQLALGLVENAYTRQALAVSFCQRTGRPAGLPQKTPLIAGLSRPVELLQPLGNQRGGRGVEAHVERRRTGDTVPLPVADRFAHAGHPAHRSQGNRGAQQSADVGRAAISKLMILSFPTRGFLFGYKIFNIQVPISKQVPIFKI